MSKVIDLFDSYDGSEACPLVEERGGVLRLRFNVFDLQSEMRKNAPEELALGYTRTMAEALSLAPCLGSIGMIGLGGGSLAKYCYRHFPEAAIRVAEINPAVIELRDRFHVPEDDDRFEVSCEDGADFVRRYRDEFDVLFVDGFDRRGQPPQLSSLEFYQDCYRSLRSAGLLVVNLCGSDGLMAKIRCGFRNQVAVREGEGHLNTIVVAGKGSVLEAAADEGIDVRRSGGQKRRS